jgi:hypothetical protein
MDNLSCGNRNPPPSGWSPVAAGCPAPPSQSGQRTALGERPSDRHRFGTVIAISSER